MPEAKNRQIAGHTFSISQPYDEGHVLTAIEAKQLNQTRAENIGNNCRKAVQELLEAGDTKGAEALVADKDSTYQFTEASAGGSSRTLDPVEKEARRIAREAIKAALAAKGKKVKEVDKETLENAIVQTAAREDIMAEAKKNVARTAKAVEAASADLGL